MRLWSCLDKSTAEMINRTGTAIRPDRVDVEFGLKFTASGGVIMAGVSGEASLTVTLGYDVASRQYQRSLDINERLGNQTRLGIGYSQLGILETDRGGSTVTAIAWHVKALVIRLHLGVPHARVDLSRLSALRRSLGVGSFTSLLAETVDGAELAETVTAWLDQWDNAEDSAD